MVSRRAPPELSVAAPLDVGVDITAKKRPTEQPARRPRRSREEVTRELVAAAAALFAERPSGNVTVRDIAARAGVNPALIHRYFGTKQNLMTEAMAKSQRSIAARMDDVTDVRRDINVLYHAAVGEKEFITALARALLDGALPDFPAGYPTMQGLLTRLVEEREAHAATRSDAGVERPVDDEAASLVPSPGAAHDPRVVVACLASIALGYALFGTFIRKGTDLTEEPDDQVDEAIIEVAREIVGLALK